MYKEKMDLLEAMAKIPGLEELNIPVEDLPLSDEFNRLTDDVMAALDVDLKTLPLDADKALVLGVDGGATADHPVVPRPAPAPASAGSKRLKPVTIRIPVRVLDAYRAKASGKGVGYQTLMVRTLKDVSDSW